MAPYNYKEIRISLKSLLKQYNKVSSNTSTLSKAFYYGYKKSEDVVQITHIVFLLDNNESLCYLYESLFPSDIFLVGFTTFNVTNDKFTRVVSIEKSLLNVGHEMLESDDIETIKKMNPSMVDSMEYLISDTKCNFKFSECFVITGNDDWNTKVEMCFEKLIEKMRNLHFTSTHAFVKPVDGGECSVISSPFVSIPFNLDIEHNGSDTNDKKTETLRKAMLQLKELIKREGPEGNFTKLSRYSSNLFDDHQPFLSLKDASGKSYFETEIENIANCKEAEPEPMPVMDLDFGKLLISPHKELQHKTKDLYSLIKGDYAYYHYHCDGFDDEGWGCAYRSLQTIWSWLCFQGRINRMPPSHKEIQECLVKIGDKPSKFIGSRGWIGSFEIGYVLQNLANVEYRTLHSGSGKDLDDHSRALSFHFEHNGAPVMSGGGQYAHTILGVDYNRRTGECEYLILDPHYTGKDNVASAISGQGIVWKTKKFFDPKSYYNLLLVINP